MRLVKNPSEKRTENSCFDPVAEIKQKKKEIEYNFNHDERILREGNWPDRQ